MPVTTPGVVESLTKGQFDIVYNLLSFSLACMIFTSIFLLAVQSRVLPRYRIALVVSAMVTGIAAYHYFRIFDSFREAYRTDAIGGQGTYTLAEGVSFNEGYRYVDWLLTVPLLLVETVAVLALARSAQRSLLLKLVPASALMIVLGYPGEIADDNTSRIVWGLLSTIPFLYLLYVLFGELTRSMDRQPPEVRKTVSNLRWLLLASWGVYPIAYMFPLFDLDGAGAFLLRQGGYSIADVVAKCVFGLLIYKIARLKSAEDSPAFALDELEHGEPPKVPAGS